MINFSLIRTTAAIALMVIGGLLLWQNFSGWDFGAAQLAVSLAAVVLLMLGFQMVLPVVSGEPPGGFYLLLLGIIGLFLLFTGLSLLAGAWAKLIPAVAIIPHLFWPVVMIGAGVMLIQGRFNHLFAGNVKILGNLSVGKTPWQLTTKEFQAVIGDMEIDLTTADIPDGDTHLRINHLIGNTMVIVPGNVGLRVRGSHWIGSVKALGEHHDGLFLQFDHQTSAFSGSAKRLFLTVNSLIGDLKVFTR